MMYCLETSVVIALLRGDASMRSKVAFLANVGSDIVITHLTMCEVYAGVFLSKDKESAKASFMSFLQGVDSILGFDDKACEYYGQCYVENRKKGRVIGDVDLMIASIAAMNDATLVTLDKDFSRVDGVKVVIWDSGEKEKSQRKSGKS